MQTQEGQSVGVRRKVKLPPAFSLRERIAPFNHIRGGFLLYYKQLRMIKKCSGRLPSERAFSVSSPITDTPPVRPGGRFLMGVLGREEEITPVRGGGLAPNRCMGAARLRRGADVGVGHEGKDFGVA
jgi:hypothetical protein